MRDPFPWSMGLGRWGGIRVRLHVFFLAFAAATCYFCWTTTYDTHVLAPWWRAGGDLLGPTAAAVGLLFISILAHEFGRVGMARRAGVPIDTIMIGPLGGMAAGSVSASPRIEIVTRAVGLAVHLLLTAVFALALVLCHPELPLASLINPLEPVGLLDQTQILAVGLWINWLLFLIHTLPVRPFDGGWILHAVLSSARPRWNRRRVAEGMSRVAVALAIALAIAALVLAKHDGDSPFRSWAVLLLLAIVLLVSARREMEEADMDEPGRESDRGRGSEKAGNYAGGVPVARRALTTPATPRVKREPPSVAATPVPSEELEADEERMVDGILSRLHAHGMGSLTAAERAVLDRASARYRSRLGKRT